MFYLLYLFREMFHGKVEERKLNKLLEPEKLIVEAVFMLFEWVLKKKIIWNEY